ncbi:NADH-quinone oxidoreductase subunit NuoG [Candidatus Albibeggiatoa sp. nov. NOAA]|uniref:NADH-quinone oxidoreductase subunit NuoG n=1 Tax=Candidatus Albibeggiatoa sp. nov. NOAA TaxID=3162724 RepID=UPI0032F76AD5|nr:NADH-quinone oxidoreductase subunit NuoG [Thiotrichaceae bacterium]
MATIEIDGKPYEAQPGQMLIEVADANGINIPRFCYHKKLSVAANCRMCLVEVEKAPKPMPACATPVMDGMKAWTKSTKALAAQKSVMEFLLINHPLDCPICDQGGECELQDIAVGYGGDASRYQEQKRVVFDKNIGPLIATEMTRCIHCTRCVRFGIEIAGVQEMGATGRGDSTLIGTYIEKSVDSELSGNVVDLCPVGALTAKPSRYVARAWEMQQAESIAPHDSLGSNVYVHTRRGEVLRVAPKDNEAVNEVWLSDRDRFSYQGLTAEDRLTKPMIKQDGEWQETDWETALAFATDGLKQVMSSNSASDVGALASPTATLEELYLLQKLMRGIGVNNIDHRLRQTDFSDQDAAPLYPSLGQSVSDIEASNSILVIGSNLRKEHPLINHRVHKASKKGASVSFVNPVNYTFNYKVSHQAVAAPADLVATLAGIAKALGAELPSALSNVNADETQTAIAENLKSGESKTILLGNIAAQHTQASAIRALAVAIAKATGATLGYLADSANSAGAWLAGVLPHRKAAGATSDKGLDAQAMLSNGLKAYILLGTEPELDSNVASSTVVENLTQAAFTVSLSAYASETTKAYANVLLPIAAFTETSGTYVNLEGQWQSFDGVVAPKGEARPAWKILRVLGNLFDVNGFDYTDSTQVRDELKAAVGDKQADNSTAGQIASINGASSDIQLIAETPMYAVDSLVRRSNALQSTADSKRTGNIYVNPSLAQQKGLSEDGSAKVTQNGTEITLPVMIDERIPDNCVLLYSAEISANGQIDVSAG